MDGGVDQFGGLLRAYRRAAGLTQAALAEAAGLSERGIQNLERGVRQPYPRTLEQLIAALALTPGQATQLAALATRQHAPRGARAGRDPAPPAPPGEWKPATALCARIANLPHLRVRLDSATLGAVVANCLSIFRCEVERHGGAIERVDDNGLIALFGAPVARQDHAASALRAALAIRDALAAYQARVRRTSGAQLTFRIGLDGGAVELHRAEPASTARYDDDLDRLDDRTRSSTWRIASGGVGSPIEAAARLERHARPNAIWVGAAARHGAGDGFSWRDLPPAPSGAGRVSELLGARAGQTIGASTGAGGPAALVGRLAELERLTGAWADARAGRGRVVAVVGEAGIGKSRLIHELALRLDGEGASWIAASCFAHAEATAYHPFRELVRSSLEVPAGASGASGAAARRAVVERADALGLDAAQAPYLQHLLGVGLDDPLVRRLPPDLLRAKTVDAVVRLLLAVAARRPLAILLEDVHWIDSGSEAIVAALVDSLPTRPLLLVMTGRPEQLHPWAGSSETRRSRGPGTSPSIAATIRAILRQPQAARIDLGRLSPDESRDLVEQVVERSLSAELVGLAAERAAGNPLFAVALARSLIDHAVLDDRGLRGAPLNNGTAMPGDLPATIRDVLLARVDRLPRGLRRVLQLAAVIGPELRYPLLAEVVEPSEPLESALVQLEDLGFLNLIGMAPERRYAFDHVLMQVAVHETLLPDTAQRSHERVGRAIESLYSDHLEEHYELLAHHFAMSADDEKAVEYLTLASRKAAAASAVGDAYTYFEVARMRLDRLPVTDTSRARRVELILEQFPVMLLLGRLPAYHTLLREIEPLVTSLDSPRVQASYYCSLGACEWAGGEFRAARTTLLRAADLTPAGDDDVRAVVGITLERCELDLGHYAAALAAYEASKPLVDRHLSLLWFRWARTGAMWAYAYQGRWEEARAVAAEVLRVSAEVDDPSMQAEILLNLATISVDQGDPVRAAGEALRALDLAPTPAERLMAEATLGSVECHLGRPEQGLPALERATAALQAGGLIPAAINGGVWLGSALVVAGRPEQARATLLEHGGRAERAGMRFQQARADRLLGEIALAAGDDGDAADYLERSLALLTELGAESELARARAAYGRLLARHGEIQAACGHLTWAEATLSRLGTLGALEPVREDLDSLLADVIDV